MKRLLGIMLLGCALAGCARITPAGALALQRNRGTIPGTLRIAVHIEPATLNPIMISSTTDAMIDAFIFDQLITDDPQGDPKPDLAQMVPTQENGGISKDGLTLVYHLRHGVTWQDGAPFTSRDVKFTWQAIMNPANDTVSRSGYDQVKSVDTPDDYTVVFHLKRRFAPAINTLFAESDNPTRILPEHLLARYHDLNRVAFNAMPIGTGPFKVEQWVKGDHIALVPNPAYFMGAPKLKHIIIRVVPDENTAINELKTHEIDWMFQPSATTCRQLSNIPGVRLEYTAQNAYESIRFNVSRAPLSDVRVRRAIVAAIDKKQLVDELTCGTQAIATEDHPDWMRAHDPTVTREEYDPNRAKRLLSQAGYGHLKLLAVSNTANVTRRQAMVLVQAMLRKVGIDLQIKSYPGAQLLAPAGQGGIMQLGKFDLAFSGWYAGMDPDNSSQYLCSMIPPGGYNYTRYCSAEVGAAEREALENYDVPTRTRAYHTIEEDLARDVPESFLWWVRQVQPISTDLRGFDPNPVTASWNSYQWTI